MDGGAHPGLRSSSEPAAQLKPLLRGWLHAGTFPAAIAAGIVLITLAPGGRARVAVTVYAVSSWLLFGISAAYHRGTWSPRMSRLLKRLDHSNIFLIIAGTYTPFAVLLLHGTERAVVLWLVWAGGLAGVVFRVLWVEAPRWLYTPLYAALGWVAVFFLPQLLHAGGVATLVLITVGGALYSAGGLVYGTKRPHLAPRIFGFHELFHALTVAAFVLQYIAVSLVAYRT